MVAFQEYSVQSTRPAPTSALSLSDLLVNFLSAFEVLLALTVGALSQIAVLPICG